MAPASLIHTPLGDPTSNIRLLEIFVRDASKRPRVACRMRTVPLRGVPPYAALSYVWGDPGERENIIVNSQCVSVTKNLESALQQAPHLQRIHPACGPTFLLWVDAICIDQGNDAERTAQVGLMARLFQEAECVFAWLGVQDEDLAFRAMRPMMSEISRLNDQTKESAWLETLAGMKWLSGYPDLCKDDVLVSRDPTIRDIPTLFNSCWSAINDLLTRKYWTRVWIFQEAVLAKRLILACPTAAMVFDDLWQLGMILENIQWYLRNLPAAKPKFLGSSAWYYFRDIVDWSPVTRIMRERNARKSQPGPHERVRRCALSKVSYDLDATDARDHVYGLLALTGLDIEPDYTKTPSQVCAEFSLAWIETFKSTPVLCELMFLAYSGIGIFGEGQSVPSWIPNFQCQSELKIKVSSSRMNKDIFPPSTPAASICLDRQMLVAPGFEFDSVKKVHEIPLSSELEMPMSKVMEEMKNIMSIFSPHNTSKAGQKHKSSPPSDAKPSSKTRDEAKRKEFRYLYLFTTNFVSRHEARYLNTIPPLQAIFRVLWCHPMSQAVLGPTIMRGLNFLKVLSTYGPESTSEDNLRGLGFALDDSFDTAFSEKMFSINGLERQISAFKGSLLEEFKTWEPIGGLTEMMELHTQLGELSRSWRLMETEKGYLGLGPKEAVHGDLVTILKGSQVPVILRRDGDYFRHIGTSFILGLMDGELAGCLDDGRFAVDEFKIL